MITPWWWSVIVHTLYQYGLDFLRSGWHFKQYECLLTSLLPKARRLSLNYSWVKCGCKNDVSNISKFPVTKLSSVMRGLREHLINFHYLPLFVCSSGAIQASVKIKDLLCMQCLWYKRALPFWHIFFQLKFCLKKDFPVTFKCWDQFIKYSGTSCNKAFSTPPCTAQLGFLWEERNNCGKLLEQYFVASIFKLKGIHPSIFHRLSKVGSRGQRPNQGGPDYPHLSSKASPGQSCVLGLPRGLQPKDVFWTPHQGGVLTRYQSFSQMTTLL